MNDKMLIVRRTKRPFEEVCRRLPEVAQQHAFGVLGVHDLKEKMEAKGIAFARECRVFEVCNPRQAQVVLNCAIEISTALPCRIAVYEEAGATVLATLKPTMLLELFQVPEAAATAREVETSLVEIMDATASVG